jgi:hypothetical protein
VRERRGRGHFGLLGGRHPRDQHQSGPGLAGAGAVDLDPDRRRHLVRPHKSGRLSAPDPAPAAGGATDPTKRWCKPTNGNVETPFWIDFNTKCWDWSGLYYDGRTPLESVMVLVPGDLVATPFNFCVLALTPHP